MMKRNNYVFFTLLALFTAAAISSCTSKMPSVALMLQTENKKLLFAENQIKGALQKSGYIINPQAKTTILLEYISDKLNDQEYQIDIQGDTLIRVIGSDPKGLMYGGFELAEQISLTGKLPQTNSKGKPFIKKRGIKFNIPLDARNPSYDDTGDAAQKNIPEMWDMKFWQEFLDNMAIHRYNVLSLWNPHPFPSMIKLKNYPEIALNDVYATTLMPTGKENEWGEPQLVSDTVMNNLKCVKKISIDEKIKFWQAVMEYAETRGIDIYLITWNICPNSVAKPVRPFYKTYGINVTYEDDGKYGITHQINNPKTIAYIRAAVKEFILTYPLIKGIGVTAGEHMPSDWKTYNREKWLWECYGEGVMDAKAIQPERKIDFIHRVWNTDLEQIMKYWGEYPDNFDLSFKYAKARLYSSPNIPFDDVLIEQMKAYKLKSWWNLRNDDIFVYRWGDPDYVRAFLTNFDKDYTAGYYMGSDGYVWGREFVSKNPPPLGRELEITKHWYNFLMWGRLGYNPALDKEFFAQKLAQKYPRTNTELLYTTWQEASKILPQVNRFHWRDWDHMFSFESCLSQFDGFRSVIDFVTNPTMEGQNILNPDQYTGLVLSNAPINGITPGEIATNLNEFAKNTFNGVSKLRMKTLSPDLNYLLIDLEAMSYLGNYYAWKIRSAVEISFYLKTGKEEYKTKALEYIQASVENWARYARISNAWYYPQMLARPGMLDWNLLMGEVKKDPDIIKKLTTKKL